MVQTAAHTGTAHLSPCKWGAGAVDVPATKACAATEVQIGAMQHINCISKETVATLCEQVNDNVSLVPGFNALSVEDKTVATRVLTGTSVSLPLGQQ